MVKNGSPHFSFHKSTFVKYALHLINLDPIDNENKDWLAFYLQSFIHHRDDTLCVRIPYLIGLVRYWLASLFIGIRRVKYKFAHFKFWLNMPDFSISLKSTDKLILIGNNKACLTTLICISLSMHTTKCVYQCIG